MRRPPPDPSVPPSGLCPLIRSILIMKRRGTLNREQLDVAQQLRETSCPRVIFSGNLPSGFFFFFFLFFQNLFLFVALPTT